MNITGTHIKYYYVCKRKLWLTLNEVQMEHTSDRVYDGKLIHENSYSQRSDKYNEIQIEGIIVDYFDTDEKIIHEIKRSDKIEEAHIWQLKYYIYVFHKNEITCSHGKLEYPLLHKTVDVHLNDQDIKLIHETIANIEHLADESCPSVINKPFCKSCSFFDFCYISE